MELVNLERIVSAVDNSEFEKAIYGARGLCLLDLKNYLICNAAGFDSGYDERSKRINAVVCGFLRRCLKNEINTPDVSKSKHDMVASQLPSYNGLENPAKSYWVDVEIPIIYSLMTNKLCFDRIQTYDDYVSIRDSVEIPDVEIQSLLAKQGYTNLDDIADYIKLFSDFFVRECERIDKVKEK